MPEQVHVCLRIPPQYSVAHTVGFLKGKAAIRSQRGFLGREKNFTGLPLWARGYGVSTVGLDEQVIRGYIRHQENAEKRQEQRQLKGLETLSCARGGS